ncbi:MAG: hypothetical protein I3270_01780 [Candidatus Moeniiplasma glomeromycotorum]|nr:hypothetical protein [Candidatus Moeniiplasma glomeromycotorum]MCE8162436.1 hypothetical protein [Candidatus Moeniiplasma glomeromycotorum]MCE8166362.1 hypothetical protein [Candidatus Moeniiplasma glomeromycotorum]MCE8166844.1 hypothetical protein [Candidatus Moeniiplasma glomeromycotorum]
MILKNLKAFWRENWLVISGGLLVLLVCLILFWVWRPEEEKKPSADFIHCPLRRKWFKKYDNGGLFTEEYQRIRLISYFLKKGYSPRWFYLEYPLIEAFGHQGKNKIKILVDLVIKKEGKVIIVVEVKKGYGVATKFSAIKHQLEPAMRFTNSKYGIYWDGTKESCLLTWKADRTFAYQPFP